MRDIFNSHPVTVLKKEISKTNIKGYSKMKKAEVVDLMMKHQARFKHIKMRGTPVKAVKSKKTVKVKPAPKKQVVKKASEKEKQEAKKEATKLRTSLADRFGKQAKAKDQPKDKKATKDEKGEARIGASRLRSRLSERFGMKAEQAEKKKKEEAKKKEKPKQILNRETINNITNEISEQMYDHVKRKEKKITGEEVIKKYKEKYQEELEMAVGGAFLPDPSVESISNKSLKEIKNEVIKKIDAIVKTEKAVKQKDKAKQQRQLENEREEKETDDMLKNLKGKKLKSKIEEIVDFSTDDTEKARIYFKFGTPSILRSSGFKIFLENYIEDQNLNEDNQKFTNKEKINIVYSDFQREWKEQNPDRDFSKMMKANKK